MPALTEVLPVYVPAPVMASVPVPAFVRLKPLPPSPIGPTASVPAVAVTVRLAPKVTVPLPMLR